jgi:hypothetical protein
VAVVALVMLGVVATVTGIGVWRLILKRDEPETQELSVGR